MGHAIRMTRHLTYIALALLTSLTSWSCATQAADDDKPF